MLALTLTLFGFLLQYSDASFVDNIMKCSYKEGDCLRKVLLDTVHEYGATGIQELNIPPIDPMSVSNVSMTVMDTISLTLLEGSVKGLKDCDIRNINLDLEKKVAYSEVYCEALAVKVRFSVEGSNQMLQSLFGTKSLNGNGKVKAKFEKLSMIVNLPVSVIKKEDGKIYLNIATGKPKYTYDVEKASFSFKNLVIANIDLTQIMTTFLNSNSKDFFKIYGSFFTDESVEFFLAFAKKFYDYVPTKYYFTDDLSQYVSN